MHDACPALWIRMLPPSPGGTVASDSAGSDAHALGYVMITVLQLQRRDTTASEGPRRRHADHPGFDD
jgi:hypothetical protein